jgi:hypothetical protein
VSVKTHLFLSDPENSYIEMHEITMVRAAQRQKILPMLGMRENKTLTRSAKSGKSSRVLNVRSTLTVLINDKLAALINIVNQLRITTLKSSTFHGSLK